MPAPTINDDFLRPPVDSHAPKQENHWFPWTVLILLLVGFSMACWIGSFLVFSRPEIPLSYKILRKLKKIDPPQRFKVQEPPKGEFMGPEKIFNRFNSLKTPELRQLNDELERSYLRNYQGNAAKDIVPYVTGRFTILDSYELGPGDFVPSGVVTLAVSSDYPKLLIEHLYCAPANVAPLIKRNLRTGMDIELRRTYELTAVIHATKMAEDGRLLLTVVPLNYGSYVFKGADGGFGLEPPNELNVAAGWPVIRAARYKEANDAYVNLRTKSGLGAMTAYRDTDKKPDTVLRGVDPTPEPAPSATPAPSAQVALANPSPGKGTPPGKKPGASPTPALVALNSTPTPKPTAAPVVKATGDNGVSLQPFLQAPSTTSTPPAGVPTPTPAVVDNSKVWRTYESGQQPTGKNLRVSDLKEFHERGGLNGDTIYLSGQFTVRAVGENRSLGIKNAVLRSAADDKVRIIVEYPTNRPIPALDSGLTRDEQRPFLITQIRVTTDGTLNVYAREIMN